MNKAKSVPDSSPGDEIQTVTIGTFDRLVLNGDGPIAVEFMSYSCEHCQEIAPIIEQVAEMVKKQEKIFKVNIVTDQELAGSYGVQATPTLIMFLNGKTIGQVEGPNPTVSSVLTAVTHPFRSIR